jgi:hypothetical protein
LAEKLNIFFRSCTALYANDVLPGQFPSHKVGSDFNSVFVTPLPQEVVSVSSSWRADGNSSFLSVVGPADCPIIAGVNFAQSDMYGVSFLSDVATLGIVSHIDSCRSSQVQANVSFRFFHEQDFGSLTEIKSLRNYCLQAAVVSGQSAEEGSVDQYHDATFLYHCSDGSEHVDFCSNYDKDIVLESSCTIWFRPSCSVFEGLNLNTSTSCSILEYSNSDVICECIVTDTTSEISSVQFMTYQEKVITLASTSSKLTILEFQSSIVVHISFVFGVLVLFALLVHFKRPGVDLSKFGVKKIAPDDPIKSIEEAIYRDARGSNYIKKYIKQTYLDKIFVGVNSCDTNSYCSRLFYEMSNSIDLIKIFNKSDKEVNFVWVTRMATRAFLVISFVFVFLQVLFPQDATVFCGNSLPTLEDSEESCDNRKVQVVLFIVNVTLNLVTT